jgi:hypothetical protein
METDAQAKLFEKNEIAERYATFLSRENPADPDYIQVRVNSNSFHCCNPTHTKLNRFRKIRMLGTTPLNGRA